MKFKFGSDGADPSTPYLNRTSTDAYDPNLNIMKSVSADDDSQWAAFKRGRAHHWPRTPKHVHAHGKKSALHPAERIIAKENLLHDKLHLSHSTANILGAGVGAALGNKLWGMMGAILGAAGGFFLSNQYFGKNKFVSHDVPMPIQPGETKVVSVPASSDIDRVYVRSIGASPVHVEALGVHGLSWDALQTSAFQQLMGAKQLQISVPKNGIGGSVELWWGNSTTV